MSRFIVVEGIDGAGKTTLVKGLSDAIASFGNQVITTREPGGTEKAEAIRERMFSGELSVAEQIELVHEGRIDHLQSKIIPALKTGTVVISDRFEMSSIVYQVWYEKEKLEPVYKTFEREIATLLGDFEPEYVHLTLPAETVRERQLQSGEINVFDAVELEPIKDRIAAYAYATQLVRGKIHEVDASPNPQQVLKEVLSKLSF